GRLLDLGRLDLRLARRVLVAVAGGLVEVRDADDLVAGLTFAEVLRGLAPGRRELLLRHGGAVAIVLDLVRGAVTDDGDVAQETAKCAPRDALLHRRRDGGVAAVLTTAAIAVEDRVRPHAVVGDVVARHARNGHPTLLDV